MKLGKFKTKKSAWDECDAFNATLKSHDELVHERINSLS